VLGFGMLGGPYDLARLVASSTPGLATEVRKSLTGDDLDRFSPERHVRPDHPPMLLLVGGEEDAWMRADQRSMAAALGGDTTAAEIPGESHMGLVMNLSRPDSPALAALLRFIEKRR
jgi:hypothetical protein